MSFRLIKDHPKQPIPDWSFTVGEDTLRAPTADKLLTKIMAYRAANGQSAGNPEHEVALSMIVKYPHLVKETETPPPKPDQLWAWINRLWRDSPAKAASDEDAKARASVCEKCPFALAMVPDMERDRRAYLLAFGNLRLSTQCAHHRWHNGLAINLSKPAEWARKDSPKGCWHPSGPQPGA